MKKQDITIWALLICLIAYSAWWYWYKYPLVEIFGVEDFQCAAANRLGKYGGEDAIKPMIKSLSKTVENNDISINLVKLHKKYRIDRETYLSELVNGILDPKIYNGNKWWLIDVLEDVTGENFHLPDRNYGYFVGKKKVRFEKSVEEVRVWWEYKKKEEKEAKIRAE